MENVINNIINKFNDILITLNLKTLQKPILNRLEKTIPILPHPGAFGAIRKFDIHTGIDIYCNDSEPVYSMFNGVVISISPFTGPKAGYPWWEDTDEISIKTRNFIITYGEISTNLKIGDTVKNGQIIGNVKRVLKKDKGRPMSMLHLEFYKSNKFNGHVEWNVNKSRPIGLIDPTKILQNIYNK